MAALKIGLIGCGHIARRVHLPILTRLPDVAVAALAEPDARRREEARRLAPAAAAFANYRELLARTDVDAVVICLPSVLHAEAAVAALERGKHIYLEKPIATCLDGAGRVLDAWRRADVVGMIGFNGRFNPLYQEVRRRLQDGALGELAGVHSVCSAAAHALPPWKQTRQSGGGVLLDLASHHVDLVRFFFGDGVCEVFASVRSQRSEGDTATLHLRMASGLVIQSFFSLSAVEEDRFEILGQRGKLAVDRHLSLGVDILAPTLRGARLERFRRVLRAVLRSPYLLRKWRSPGFEPSYPAALAHFAAAARGRCPASPDLWDGYRSLAMVAAAEESARTGRSVSAAELLSESDRRAGIGVVGWWGGGGAEECLPAGAGRR